MIRAFIILCALAFESPAVAQESWSDSSGREGRGHGPRAEDVRPDREGGSYREDRGRGDDRRHHDNRRGGWGTQGGIRFQGPTVVIRPPQVRIVRPTCYLERGIDLRGRRIWIERCW